MMMQRRVHTGSFRWTSRARRFPFLGLGSLVFSLVGLGPLVCSLAAMAEVPTLGVGDVMPEITLDDQHGDSRVIDRSTRLVLFSRDMDGGKLLQAALADAAPGLLTERGAVYVSDISGMPGFVARMFALPSMRRRPYPMLLDRTGEATAALPDVEGQATLLFLDALRVERIEHAESAEAVSTLISGVPAPSPDSSPATD